MCLLHSDLPRGLLISKPSATMWKGPWWPQLLAAWSYHATKKATWALRSPLSYPLRPHYQAWTFRVAVGWTHSPSSFLIHKEDLGTSHSSYPTTSCISVLHLYHTSRTHFLHQCRITIFNRKLDSVNPVYEAKQMPLTVNGPSLGLAP